MRVVFGTTSIDAEPHDGHYWDLRSGDLIQLGEGMFKVMTIQTCLPQWDSTKTFNLYILKDTEGHEFSTRSLDGELRFWRPIKRRK